MDNLIIPAAKILGVPVWGFDLKKFVDIAVHAILNRHKMLFTTVNTYSIVMAQENQEFLDHFKTADFVLPDGIGMVLAIRSLRKECKERVSGPEFTNTLLQRANDNGFSIFLLGSTEEMLSNIKRNFKQKYPKIKIAGSHAPPFTGIDDMDHLSIVETINRSRPDILLVGMTAPKQELFLSRNYKDLDVTFMIGVGAAFDYLAGVKKQCPEIVGKLGFEWLYRLTHSPKHVWKREITIPIFIYYFLTKQFFAIRK